MIMNKMQFFFKFSLQSRNFCLKKLKILFLMAQIETSSWQITKLLRTKFQL